MKRQIIEPYKFTKTATDTMPDKAIISQLFFKLKDNKRLTRSEKDNLFHNLQSNSGGVNYRILGWVFPFGQFMKTYLVKYKYETDKWIEVKAPDKTAIRKCYYSNKDILQILELTQ